MCARPADTMVMVLNQLQNFVTQSNMITTDTISWNKKSNRKADHYRSTAIRWIKDTSILAGLCIEARDTSIQIFDRFMGLAQLNDENVLEYHKIQTVAAVCVLLSSKIHEVKALASRNFPHIKPQELVRTEREILEKLHYSLFPSASPAMFIRLYIQQSTVSEEQKKEITTAADRIVGDLYEDPKATLYTPSTIGIAALLVACCNLSIDNRCWLTQIPMEFLLGENKTCPSNDVDGCLQVINRRRNSPSPILIPRESNGLKRVLFNNNTTSSNTSDNLVPLMNSKRLKKNSSAEDSILSPTWVSPLRIESISINLESL